MFRATNRLLHFERSRGAFRVVSLACATYRSRSSTLGIDDSLWLVGLRVQSYAIANCHSDDKGG